MSGQLMRDIGKNFFYNFFFKLTTEAGGLLAVSENSHQCKYLANFNTAGV